MTPNEAAIRMILMAVATLVVLFVFGKNPIKDSSIKKRLAAALFAGFVSLMILGTSIVRTYCIGFPEMGYQLVLAPICIFLVIIFIKRKVVIIASCILLFYNGGRVGAEFYQLIRNSDEYVAIDHGRRPVAKNCEELRSDIAAQKLWHSWFTGIYGVKR
jgi:hypothetical protein